MRRPVDEPQRAAGGVLRVHLREVEQLEVLAEALALELLEDQRIDAEGHREAAAHHELGDLAGVAAEDGLQDRKSTRLNSSHGYISYAVFCLKKKKKKDPIVVHR